MPFRLKLFLLVRESPINDNTVTAACSNIHYESIGFARNFDGGEGKMKKIL